MANSNHRTSPKRAWGFGQPTQSLANLLPKMHRIGLVLAKYRKTNLVIWAAFAGCRKECQCPFTLTAID
jgi:hypothetical protein